MRRSATARRLVRLESDVERLYTELSQLHTLVVRDQRSNLDRLNAWREHCLLDGSAAAIELQGAFNGQLSKVEIFQELFAGRTLRLALETGTYHGHTTRYLAQAFERVVTIEIDRTHRKLAMARCTGADNIDFVLGSSGRIKQIWPRLGVAARTIDFAYLDAHWKDHCPLPEELDFVLSSAPDTVVFIDDFKVEGDEGYGFDAYPSMTLDLAAIGHVLLKHQAVAYFPVRRAIDDTSIYFHHLPPRGTLVVGRGKVAKRLAKAKTLRPA